MNSEPIISLKVLHRAYYYFTILIVPIVLIGLVLYYRPFFGHMDDGRMLDLLDSGDFERHLSHFTNKDYGYIGGTAFSHLLILPSYHFGNVFGPIALHSINIVLVTAIIGIFLFALAQVGLFSKQYLPVAITASFLWPLTVELIFFPSLHEKGIILSTAFLFLWVRHSINVKSHTIFWAVTVALFLLSATSKTHVVLFLPAVAVAAWAIRKEYSDLTRPMGIIFFAFVTVAIISIAGLTGNYSGAQKTGSLVTNALSKYSIVMLSVVLAYGFYLILRMSRGALRPLEFVPLVMMVTMWVGIVYFGYRNYFLSIFGPMFGAAVAVAVSHLRGALQFRTVTAAVIFVTVAWILFRIPQVFLPLHGIGAFTQGDLARDLARKGLDVYVSCVEGAGHFQFYTLRKWGVSPNFRPLEGQGGYGFGIPNEADLIFGDQRLCPFPSEVETWRVIWSSGGDDGFQLYKRASQ